jgi:hypothetical protein
MNNNKISNLLDPVSAQDGVTKVFSDYFNSYNNVFIVDATKNTAAYNTGNNTYSTV